MSQTFRFCTAVALLSTATPAFAWTWEAEPEFRDWRTDTIQWAQDIAYDELGETYSEQDIVTLFAPPVAEPWCVENPAPKVEDCAVYEFRVRSWLRDFLDLEPYQTLPAGLPEQPPECVSICN